jgi:hypothetical protein
MDRAARHADQVRTDRHLVPSIMSSSQTASRLDGTRLAHFLPSRIPPNLNGQGSAPSLRSVAPD